MKKSTLFFSGLMAILFLSVVLICTSNQKITEEKMGISRKEAAGFIAKAVAKEDEISKEYNEDFSKMEVRKKYEFYMKYVCDKGYMHKIKNDFLPKQKFTYGDYKTLAQKIGITKKEYENRNEKEVMSRKEFYGFFEKILEKTGNPQEVTKKVCYVYERKGNDLITNIGSFGFMGDGKNHQNQTVDAYFSGQECLGILKKNTTEEITFKNAWVISAGNSIVKMFYDGYLISFSYKGKGLLQKFVADVQIKNGKVVLLGKKDQMISGKINSLEGQKIEFDGYGIYSLKEDGKIYQIYQDVKSAELNELKVGYENITAVLENGEIAAILLEKPPKSERVRIVLNTSGYTSLFHSSFLAVCNTDMKMISSNDKKDCKIIKAGEKMSFDMNSKELDKGRMVLTPVSEDGKITITSITRAQGNPSYRGSVEITKKQEGLVIVNNVDMEEYLYAVIPSEMPVSYGAEALKVQALCARSFAYCQLSSKKFEAYGANMDDSTKCQVYNNSPECEESIKAVRETQGEVITYKNKPVNAYFFSTSCGVTSNATDVWFSDGILKKKCPVYLCGKLQSLNDDKIDFSKEENFRKFLLEDTYDTFEKNLPWYRWKVTMSQEHLTKTLKNKLPQIVNSIACLQPDGNFVKQAVTDIGKVKSVEITQRGNSGVAKEMILKGEKVTIKITSEYAIRMALAPLYDKIIQNDGKSISFSMLPSAYICIDNIKGKKGNIVFSIHGGGYGHGVGISQNGVKILCEMGKTKEEIIRHYFKNSKIQKIQNES